MDIAILGTGNVGSALASRWASRGHRVVLGSRDPDRARALAATIGHQADGASIGDAAGGAEVVALATPWEGTRETLLAAGSLAGKPLIDCTNPLRPDDPTEFADLGGAASGAALVAAWSPGARVVKAFNTVFSHVMKTGARFGDQDASLLYCGDDADAKAVAARLAADATFEPVDAGSLDNAGLLEHLALLVIRMAFRQGLGPDFGLKILRR